MLIAGLCVIALLIVTSIFLWRTALSGISFFYIVYRNEDDMKRLKKLTYVSFILIICGLLYLGGLITNLLLV